MEIGGRISIIWGGFQPEGQGLSALQVQEQAAGRQSLMARGEISKLGQMLPEYYP